MPLRKAAVRALERLGQAFLGAGQRLALGERFGPYRGWVAANGDRTLRLDYPLEQSSVVWDVGGFEGQWSSDIHGRFGCRCDLFEPEPGAVAELRKRFRGNPRIVVHPFALDRHDGRVCIHGSGDAVSIAQSSSPGVGEVEVRDVVAFWHEQGSPRIDLMKLNIEGAEYPLIERMHEGGMLASVRHLQVQFHDFVPQAAGRRNRCTELLLATHERRWNYEFVWESWSLREGS